MLFSSRIGDIPQPNRLSIALARARKERREILDLTASNPTTVDLEYPFAHIAAALERGARTGYEPHALGLPSARETIANRIGCASDDIVITASTSEAYTFLFKLLADPGSEILTGRPVYPLLEHLAEIESCTVRQFPLSHDRAAGWSIEMDSVREGLTGATRAIVVVNPNNPTGSFVSTSQASDLAELCMQQRVALVSDEVFLPYPLEADAPPSLASLDLPCLTVSLGGLSKEAGMPHLKVGWMRLGGPPHLKAEARARLEIIADTLLSVATPVQAALAELFEIGDGIRRQIRTRTRANLDAIRRAVKPHPHVECLRVDGGWSAILRVPRLMPDEDLAIRILEDADVLVHPGHFFDFEREGHLVVSLLGADVETAMERVMGVVRG